MNLLTLLHDRRLTFTRVSVFVQLDTHDMYGLSIVAKSILHVQEPWLVKRWLTKLAVRLHADRVVRV